LPNHFSESFYYHLSKSDAKAAFTTKDSLLVDHYEIKTNEEMADTLAEMVAINDSLEQMWKICEFYLKCNLSLNPELNIHLMNANMTHESKLYPVLMENIKKSKKEEKARTYSPGGMQKLIVKL
jgi:hypothetical protein